MTHLIDQKAHFANDFGAVSRSSAIFYYCRNAHTRTTISFANYWAFKNKLKVRLIATVRDLSGRQLLCEELAFERGQVINYSPLEQGEGSVEIEALSEDGLRIPYAAIMALYECPRSISMVHSYGRAYAQTEIDEGRVIPAGEESCWTLRDDAQFESGCIFHNGMHTVAPQILTCRITRHDGQQRVVEHKIGELAAYQTLVFAPGNVMEGLPEWLEGKPGNASLSFALGGAFTRMLCFTRARDGSQMQVTHSNFNYARHRTDTLEAGQDAYMQLPALPDGVSSSIAIYPDMHPGQYSVATIPPLAFTQGQRVEFTAASQLPVRFECLDGALPSRIVTAIQAQPQDASLLPAECSVGVFHAARPPKSFHWGVVGKAGESWLLVTALEMLYGDIAEEDVDITLYSAARQDVLMRRVPLADLLQQQGRWRLDALFAEAEDFLGGDYGYIAVRSVYGGLVCYTLLQSQSGAVTLEHSF